MCDGPCNIIAYNGENGVLIFERPNAFETTRGNAIRGNSIFFNRGLGIDLQGDGVTHNDLDDGDGGGNSQKNFPELTSIVFDGTETVITGTFNSPINSPHTLD